MRSDPKKERQALRDMRRTWTAGAVGLAAIALLISFAVSGEKAWTLRGIGLSWLLIAVAYRWYIDRRITAIDDAAPPNSD